MTFFGEVVPHDHTVEDSELASKTRGAIRSLLSANAKSVSRLWGDTKILLLANAQFQVQPREDKSFLYLTVRKDGKSVAEVSLAGYNHPHVTFGAYPKPAIPWGKGALEKLLKQLPSYHVMSGINLPYGYVRNGRITTIFVRRSSDYMGYEGDRFVLEGGELPADGIFDSSMNNAQWCDRFWSLVKSGKVVPLREGKELSGWEPSGRLPSVRVSDMTSNRALLVKEGNYVLQQWRKYYY